jgi:hypothetical protein
MANDDADDPATDDGWPKFPSVIKDGVETVTVTVDGALAYFDKCDLFWLQTREMVACGKTLAEEVRRLREGRQ